MSSMSEPPRARSNFGNMLWDFVLLNVLKVWSLLGSMAAPLRLGSRQHWIVGSCLDTSAGESTAMSARNGPTGPRFCQVSFSTLKFLSHLTLIFSHLHSTKEASGSRCIRSSDSYLGYLLCVSIYWGLQTWKNADEPYCLIGWGKLRRQRHNLCSMDKSSKCFNFQNSLCPRMPGVVLPVLSTHLTCLTMSPEVLMTSFQMPSSGQTCGTKVADGSKGPSWFKMV